MGFVIRLQITLKKQLILCESLYQLTEHAFIFILNYKLTKQLYLKSLDIVLITSIVYIWWIVGYDGV